MQYPVIDLFAGPGGLGEGFASYKNGGRRPFKIALSVEREAAAHKTLLLRSFYRQFETDDVPGLYYEYLKGNISREHLLTSYPAQAEAASNEAWRAELGGVPSTEVDRRIIKALGGRKRWILVGGPPCQAYSLAGRSRMRTTNPKFEADERHFLYKEYLRIIQRFMPPIFVMENVKGILSSKVAGQEIFERIVADLQSPHGDRQDYWVSSFTVPADQAALSPQDFVVKSELHGIPQHRHRVLLLGIRTDIRVPQDTLFFHGRTPTVEDAISDLPLLRSQLSREVDSFPKWQEVVSSTWEKNTLGHYYSNEVGNLMQRSLQHLVDLPLGNDRYLDLATTNSTSDWLNQNKDWFYDERLGNGVLNHKTRAHMRSDLQRYFFAAVFSKVFGQSPRLRDFPPALLPSHRNVSKALSAGMFNDRFRVQISNNAATTVVSHIAKDGHYFIHPDPLQCRSLTVREAARLQTFPDNYYFEGSRTDQYRQVGNAVPPLLARELADIVFLLLEDHRRQAYAVAPEVVHGV